MDGNQAIAYGLIAAGVRYGAGLPDHAVVVDQWKFCDANSRNTAEFFVQAETSSARFRSRLVSPTPDISPSPAAPVPGISRQSEAIGWASMGRIPLIICNIQRGGPSTGLPTNVEQSDLHQAIFGSHGDSPRVVSRLHG